MGRCDRVADEIEISATENTKVNTELNEVGCFCVTPCLNSFNSVVKTKHIIQRTNDLIHINKFIMAKGMSKISTSRAAQKKLSALSPFELKNKLIALGEETAKKNSDVLLNAGRGNPNWISTIPREAFLLLGKFSLEECKRVFLEGAGLAGIPDSNGIAKRFVKFMDEQEPSAGLTLLKNSYNYGIEQHSFDADEWVHELCESFIGCQYPVPDRILKHIEPIVHDYLVKEMCDNKPPKGKYDLFAVEGGTAAMCYIFDSLMQNYLIKKGDTIALMVPTFTPYIEIPELDRYQFNVIEIHASGTTKEGRHTWQYPDKELDKIKNKKVKVLFVVNPSNPPSRAIQATGLKKLIQIVKKDNPGLMIVTDDVYGTFIPGFRSLMAEIPFNTICVYSFSKYFGCTGWRLGVIAIHEKNIYDVKISTLPATVSRELNKRYGTISLQPEKLKFIDRMVADSRQVALNHTAGLSLPQQTQMALFALSALLDKENIYKQLTQEIVHRRLKMLWEHIDLPQMIDPLNTGYYSEIDIKIWAEKNHGEIFFQWLQKNFEPTDILFRLAEKTSIVLLNGGGFAGPEWSIRVSLANLPDESYPEIGKSLEEILDEYAAAWKNNN